MTIFRPLCSKPLLTALALLLVCARTAAADSLTLMWDLNAEPDVTSYRVHVGTQTGVYTQIVDVGNTNTYVLSNPVAGQQYCFAVTAVAGTLVSPLSTEVCGATNGAPYLSTPANQTTVVGQGAVLQLSGGDPDGDTITYAATGLPSGLTLATSSGQISGIAKTAGTYTVSASVSDGKLSANTSFTWTVSAVSNGAPTLTNPGTRTATVGVATSLQLQGNDPNGDALTYSATGLPAGLTLATNTGLISGTAKTSGTYAVAATVSDGALSAQVNFSWTVAPAPNASPTMTNPGARTATVGVATSLQLQASDPNGNTLTYSATGLPSGLTLAANTGLISGTPKTAGTYAVTATVSDGALSAQVNFSWTVAPAPNASPTMTNPGARTATVGVATTLQLQASDPNGNTLTYSATGLPSGLTLATNTGLISGTPKTAGTYAVTATVSDGALSAQVAFSWTVAQAANVAPTMTAPANQTTTVGVAASLQLQASDANGNTLTYSATGLPAGLAISASTGLISGTPTTAGTYAVTAVVSDGALSAQATFSWSVTAPVGSTTDPTVSKPVKTRGNSGDNSTTIGNGRKKTTDSTSTTEYTGMTATVRTVQASEIESTGSYTGAVAKKRTVAASSGSKSTTSSARLSGDATQSTTLLTRSVAQAEETTATLLDEGGADVNVPTAIASSTPVPTVRIETPVDAFTVTAGATVHFVGAAAEVSGTDISKRIVWTSSVDGALGTGASVTAPLSAGSHVVTASVIDRRGRKASAQITVVVQ